jgi:hypothetical protein
VFRNDQQQEYLGARTSVLGIDRNFDLARDYYVNFHDLNPQAPQSALGMPLLITAGMAQLPGPQEILVSSRVTDYVGVQPGAGATVEFIYNGAGEPIVERFDGLRLIGIFDMAGPDQGRGSSHSGGSTREDRMSSPFAVSRRGSAPPHCHLL